MKTGNSRPWASIKKPGYRVAIASYMRPEGFDLQLEHMPISALRPCAYPGCSALVAAGKCDVHRKGQDDPATATRERKFYWSPRWRITRAAFLRANPFCAVCQAQDPPHVALAQVVDHIVPISRGGDRLDWRNLQGLCTPHHNSKTRRETLQNEH